MSDTRANHISRRTDARPPRFTALRNFCGKVFYDSRADARRAVKSLRARGKYAVPGEELREYRCNACGLWHVGNGRTIQIKGYQWQNPN